MDPAAGQVDCFPQEITRVLLNLISNGFYAATKRKGQTDRQRLRADARDRDAGTSVTALRYEYGTTAPAFRRR